jgi:hypothetical protein
MGTQSEGTIIMDNLSTSSIGAINQSETTFPVRLLTKSSVASSNAHRLVEIRFKKSEDNPVPHANRCVSIPLLSITCQPSCLQQALQDAFNKIVDDFIRERVTADLDAKRETPASFHPSQLTADAIATWYAETAIGGRLTKELIEAWFTVSMRPSLEEALASVPDMTDAKLASMITGYQSGFSILSSPQAIAKLKSDDCKNLSFVLDRFTTADDSIAAKLRSRIATVMLPREAIAMLDISSML